MMKKVFALFLALLLCFSLTACGGGREVISGFDGTPALNRNLIGNHIERVELTVDNWSDYIKEYSYDVELIEKDAFGEVTKKKRSPSTAWVTAPNAIIASVPPSN